MSISGFNFSKKGYWLGLEYGYVTRTLSYISLYRFRCPRGFREVGFDLTIDGVWGAEWAVWKRRWDGGGRGCCDWGDVWAAVGKMHGRRVLVRDPLKSVTEAQ